MTDHVPPARDRHLHLGVRVDGAGSESEAWRRPDANASALFTADHLVRLTTLAERGLLDFVTVPDAFGPVHGAAALPGRLDALLSLARVAPHTRAIGLVPTITTTHTEPFHVSKNVATLDLVSGGRAGWHVAVSDTAEAAALFGRKPVAPRDELVDEAGDAVEVVRRLWDSWEDDTVIRDVATGRYIDRDKLHPIAFTGRYFSVRGPSITPRSPQAQPLVAVDADDALGRDLAAHHADLAFVAARNAIDVQAARAQIRDATVAAGHAADDVFVMAVAPARFEAAPEAEAFADRLTDWFAAGVVDGFVVEPARLPHDLAILVDTVVPRLQRRGVFRTAYTANTLRGHFGLARPDNRYAVAS